MKEMIKEREKLEKQMKLFEQDVLNLSDENKDTISMLRSTLNHPELCTYECLL